MSITIDVRDLPECFREAIDIAVAGDEVIVSEGATPLARLVPLAPSGQQLQPRVAGLHAEAITAAPDFDAPMPEEFWIGQP
jgi:antitoxin (DNA-binding transcriptional repressor) of toxin-antitoxin stability system